MLFITVTLKVIYEVLILGVIGGLISLAVRKARGSQISLFKAFVLVALSITAGVATNVLLFSLGLYHVPSRLALSVIAAVFAKEIVYHITNFLSRD